MSKLYKKFLELKDSDSNSLYNADFGNPENGILFSIFLIYKKINMILCMNLYHIDNKTLLLLTT